MRSSIGSTDCEYMGRGSRGGRNRKRKPAGNAAEGDEETDADPEDAAGEEVGGYAPDAMAAE